MGGGPDRRPWLILSQSECEALREAALPLRSPSPVLLRALRMIDEQMSFIHDGYGEEPTIRAALKREAEA